ncbi:MAG TPA: glycosyltransferase family 4 protein [Erysipelotrichaceae bacterium]|nr:glycosyltransferase family 4 protein [Erysipelotrichaceae bacterium]
MDDIVFLSRIIPEHMNEVKLNRKNTMTESGEALMWKIIRGLDANLNHPITLMNYLPVQSYPKNYNKPFIKRSIFSHALGAVDINLPFNNVQYIKRLFMGRSLQKEIKKWASKKTNHRKILISYSMYPETMRAMKVAKRIDSKITTCVIVADLPQYTILTNKISFSSRIYLSWLKKNTFNKLLYIDKFVLLTEFMSEKLVSNQEYIVMEGISTNFNQNVVGDKREKNIVYAGTLNEKFGIKHLVDAFSKVQSEEYKLVICGMGDSEDYIKMQSNKDSRIVFLGQLERMKALEVISTASIIVNPRFEKEEYTKYSFPSKNLEALSSGIPFIAYKLAGIPEEYDSYIVYPKNESTDALTDTIQEVINNYDYYCDRAKKAEEWVSKEKNEKKQGKRILDLIYEKK